MKKIIYILLAGSLLSACSVPAPKYAASYDNVQMLKQAKSKVEVTQFNSANTALGSISLRGNTLTSPYGQDLIHYLQIALESELEKAGLLQKGSAKKLTAVIEENDIDVSGFSEGYGKLQATFSVTENGKVLYSKSIGISKQWESSFVGAIAIPAAAEMYPKMASDLLNKLYSDQGFISVLKS